MWDRLCPTPPPGADVATRRRLAVNYSQRSSCLRNLWSAPLSVKSPFKGLRTGRRRRRKVASQRSSRRVEAAGAFLHWRKKWLLHRAGKAPIRSSHCSSDGGGGERTRNAEKKNLTSCKISASSLESHSASTATETFPFQHLHLYPVEREGGFCFF